MSLVLRPYLLLLCAALTLLCGTLAFARGPMPSAQDTHAVVLVADLPREAQQTLALIRAGGPFPHAKDGSVFGNYERRLPPRPRGSYHEYTVPTPGARNRGARRLIASEDRYWYTDDHYQSFREVRQ